MKHWLVCRVVDLGNVSLPEPFCIGFAEVSRAPDWNAASESALQASMRAYSVTAEKPFRLRYWLSAASYETAVRLELSYSRQVLEFWRSATQLLTAPVLLGPGVLTPVEGDAPRPMLPERPLHGVVAILIDERASGVKLGIDAALASSVAQTELGVATRRSKHWSSKANEEYEPAHRFLDLWIALEALCGEQPAAIRLLAALGMPRGRFWSRLSPRQQEALGQVKPTSVQWERGLTSLLGKARELRNEIAHAGAMHLDVTSFYKPVEFAQVMMALDLGVPRVQGLALGALRNGYKTVDELWSHYGKVLPAGTADDLTGNILYGLDNLVRDWRE